MNMEQKNILDKFMESIQEEVNTTLICKTTEEFYLAKSYLDTYCSLNDVHYDHMFDLYYSEESVKEFFEYDGEYEAGCNTFACFSFSRMYGTYVGHYYMDEDDELVLEFESGAVVELV